MKTPRWQRRIVARRITRDVAAYGRAGRWAEAFAAECEARAVLAGRV